MNEELTSKQGDLDWLAFRFVAGELTPDDARDFELRLATDQAAREAVSAAAGLSLRLAAAKPVEHLTLARPAGKPVLLGRMWDPLESTCRHASLSIL